MNEYKIKEANTKIKKNVSFTVPALLMWKIIKKIPDI